MIGCANARVGGGGGVGGTEKVGGTVEVDAVGRVCWVWDGIEGCGRKNRQRCTDAGGGRRWGTIGCADVSAVSGVG